MFKDRDQSGSIIEENSHSCTCAVMFLDDYSILIGMNLRVRGKSHVSVSVDDRIRIVAGSVPLNSSIYASKGHSLVIG